MKDEKLLILNDGVIDWEPLLRGMIEGREVTARMFIESLAEVIVSLADRTPGLPVILTGGVFQNKTLMERVLPRLKEHRLLLPRRLPPNDGAIALGQVWRGLSFSR
jgi:hydrogenase maturation protein HypF